MQYYNKSFSAGYPYCRGRGLSKLTRKVDEDELGVHPRCSSAGNFWVGVCCWSVFLLPLQEHKYHEKVKAIIRVKLPVSSCFEVYSPTVVDLISRGWKKQLFYWDNKHQNSPLWSRCSVALTPLSMKVRMAIATWKNGISSVLFGARDEQSVPATMNTISWSNKDTKVMWLLLQSCWRW